MKYPSLLLFLFLSCSVLLSAQQDNYASVNSNLWGIWNPSLSATQEEGQVGVSARRRWVGFEGAPASYFLNYEQPLHDWRSGVGLHMVYDERGPLSYVQGSFSYAYRIPVGRGNLSSFSMGLSFGFNQYQIDQGKLILSSGEPDPLLHVFSGRYLGYRAGMGLTYRYFSSRDYRADEILFSAAFYRDLPSRYPDGADILLEERDYLHAMFSARYHPGDSDFYFRPLILANTFYFRYVRTEFHLNAGLDALGWVGAGLFPFEELSFNIGLDEYLFAIPISLQIVYHYNIHKIPTRQSSSFDLVLSYKFGRR